MAHISEVSVSVELQTSDMTLNIGPQHPSTHGVLRLVAKVDGERVRSVEPVIGYMHRGYEKLAEVRTYPQITALVNRIDWVSGFANEIPFIVAAERLMGLEVPERAQYIRLILTEMARISSHLIFMSSYPLEIGAATPLMHALRERERVLDLLESVTGGRFHPNFNRLGGVKPAAGAGAQTKKVVQDLPQGFLQDTKAAMVKMFEICDDLEGLVTGNEIFQARTVGIGVMPADRAAAFGVSGPNLRASGPDFDLRKHTDYLPYDKFEFEIPIGRNGDCFDRYQVRLEEIRQSASIINQAIDTIPSGPLQAKVPKIIKVPAGEIYVRAENPKGEMGYHLISDGGRVPYRLKIRSASFSNLSVLPWLLEDQLVPDLIAILGSLDFVLGDVDR
ncbi:MAG: NADH-quinone oxidoreductase subunit D [Acidimicrobiia bacterium]|nr:NADH-quinone oxidoreductase subunit D [Acidimicrobiia bacterium]NNC41966.1 NADH-quinone oxidoreductase subunit D [Acidimicrobiia bacterium]NND14196.1 NADH-quinone oxidoreductase subunit D [Acidimicrobiia bacterium]NNL28325.1 NADH-quinone oxidoreductase subunit D [Acidimicrobiia bacterium]